MGFALIQNTETILMLVLNDSGIRLNSSGGSTNLTEIPAWLQHSQTLTTWFAVTMALGLLGTLMNAFLFLTICRDKNLRKGSGLQIAHLVLVETFICAYSISSNTIMTYLGGPYKNDTSICPFVHSVLVWATYSGLWSTTFIAASRCLAILFPVPYRRMNTNALIIGMIVASWVIGFVMVVPNYFELGVKYTRIPPWYNCGNRPTNRRVYTVTLTLGQYLPGALSGIIYFIILCKTSVYLAHVRGRADSVAPQLAGGIIRVLQSTPAARHRLATVRMLAVSAVWYWVCFFPNPTIVSYFPGVFMRWPVMQLWIRTVLWCAYIFNPVRLV